MKVFYNEEPKKGIGRRHPILGENQEKGEMK